VEYFRAQNKLPALAAIMVQGGQIIEKSAVGKRSSTANIPVTVNDQWHVGSITKSMTSTLAALLVKNGFIQWNSTLEDVYPELVGTMLPEYQDVRLDELLSHTSGLPLDIPDLVSYYTDTRALTVQRQEIVEKVLALSSTTTRGVYQYSNLGYIVAGAMLEIVTGSSWETLVQTYLFTPLSMTQAGFGAPDTEGTLAQPVGHIQDLGNWYPVDPSVEDISDNPPVLGPAGTVHASLDDMAAYIGLHLKGLQGETVDGFLTGQEFAKLYTPFPNSSYALGWVVMDNKIAHDGSNTLWLAAVLVDAGKDTAFFVVTNAVDNLENPNSKTNRAIIGLLDELNARVDAVVQ
jgi:CubicO group peptidase (beta-lactamase class C family)